MSKQKRINVLEFAKLHAVIFGIVGLACGILYSFGGLIIDTLVTLGWVTTEETPGLSYGTVLAFGALIGMPLIALSFGFVIGLAEALIFNLFSRWLGWLKLEFK